jgi:hypothetical protein
MPTLEIPTDKPQRKLTDHRLNGLNESIDIFVMDEPGPGGACHEYMLVLTPALGADHNEVISSTIEFQKGPIAEAGMNGFTQEALLVVVIDRLRCFQAGQYACRENAIALTKLEEALMWLQKRTRDRLARGVEGTSKV